MRHLRLFCVFLAVLVASCGGGSDGDPLGALSPHAAPSALTPKSYPAPFPDPITREVAFFGDSLTHGGDVGSDHLDPRPVPYMTWIANGRWHGNDLAENGMRCWELSAPSVVYDVYVFRYGMADYVKGTPLTDYLQCIDVVVEYAKSLDKPVYVVGIIKIPGPMDSDLKIWNAALKAKAEELEVPFIDVRCMGILTMYDDIHPDQDGSERVSLFIASHIF